ncbi:MAG: polar amino acid transport system permease [Planctomycetota bacterium]|nr:MAG: polar amino acid transport system permease [Planctomycetota bacterium]
MNIKLYVQTLLPALGWTALLTVTSLTVGVALGLVIGLARVGPVRSLRNAAAIYVELVRGIPLFVQILYIYYGIGYLIRNIYVPSPFVSATVAFGICYAAYIAEIFRAGFQSLDRGQAEAARALGMTRRQTTRLVLLPQAFRNILPALGNEGVALLKDTSLASVVTIGELTQAGRALSSLTLKSFEVWTVVALIYVALTLPLSWGVRKLEARLRVRGAAHPA